MHQIPKHPVKPTSTEQGGPSVGAAAVVVTILAIALVGYLTVIVGAVLLIRDLAALVAGTN